MAIELRKSLFSRNRNREGLFGNQLSKLSSEISFLSGLLAAVFFTPTIIIGSLLSKEILVIAANIFLSMGYSANFFYRFYSNDISVSELLISSLVLGFFIVNAYLLMPTVTTITFINVLTVANYAATAINSFFLIRHVVVPPCKHLIEQLASWLGFKLEGRYFTVAPLSLDKDVFVIDELLRRTYKYDSEDPKYQADKLTPWNNLLLKLSGYIDKYNEPFLGYVKNKGHISALEKRIDELTIEGKTESSYQFIKMKINFKTTKLGKLNKALDELTKIESKTLPQEHWRFFKSSSASDLQSTPHLLNERQWLKQEIHRQQEKLDALKSCLPEPEILKLNI
jgi:hypothetical protein